MTKQQAIDRAAAIWIGLPVTVRAQSSAGGGWYVFVDGDNRTHILSAAGYVLCGHPNCLAREDKAK